MLIQVLVFFTPIGMLFGLLKITPMQFLAVIGINIVAFLIIELVKPIMAKCFKDK